MCRCANSRPVHVILRHLRPGRGCAARRRRDGGGRGGAPRQPAAVQQDQPAAG